MFLMTAQVASRNPLTERPAPAQVLLRGLSLLEALNRRAVGAVEELAHDTRLPKSTVVRLLNILVTAGYVRRLPKRGGYSLAERVLGLSWGFRSEDAVVEAARPILAAFTAEHKWPVSIATLAVDVMRIRATTLQDSPFAIDRERINRRVPLLASALGRAYLAYCSETERQSIIALLRNSRRPVDRPAGDPGYLAALVRGVRRAGYAVTPPIANDPIAGLAVPVSRGSRVFACLTMRYPRRAMTEAEAVERYLRPLRQAARAIADAAANRYLSETAAGDPA
jgi:IclR family transcriptional regulator, mhp operon transcriptional activator